MSISCNQVHEDSSVSPSERPQHIIMIVTDDQGWGDLGVNDNPHIHTPHLDTLARAGVQFSRYYVSPVCSPTRAELLTGRYHPRGGVYSTSQGGERLDLDETTVAELLQEQGYRTAAFGKWHNGSQPPYHPNNRGFEEFYGFCSGHWGNYFSPMLEHNGAVVKGEGFIIDDLTDHAMDFISDEDDRPSFTLLAYNTPHSPMQVPDEWWDRYADGPIDQTHRYVDREKMDKTKAAYALCENIDYNIGRLIAHLDSEGLREETMIIYMSDNGPNGYRWNDGLKGVKGHTDEGGVRSPLIISWPGQLAEHEVDQVASGIDMLPTILDYAGGRIPDDIALDGVSLRPIIEGDSADWPDRYVYSHWSGRVSVRGQRYLLDHEDQLYDLLEAPGQYTAIMDTTLSVYQELYEAKQRWISEVLSELDRDREEIFPIGHPDSRYTQLPARDAVASGEIQRSNRWPNSSYFMHWVDTKDSITWDCEVLTSGRYRVTIYQTCQEDAIGSVIELRAGAHSTSATLTAAHDTEVQGKQYDRIPREEGYEKDFAPLDMGVITLDAGPQELSLHAVEMTGMELLEMRLLVLERVE